MGRGWGGREDHGQEAWDSALVHPFKLHMCVCVCVCVCVILVFCVLGYAEKNLRFYSHEAYRVRKVTHDVYLGTLHPKNLTHTWHLETLHCSLFVPRTQKNEKLQSNVKTKLL